MASLTGHFGAMARNNRWANRRLHEAVGELDQAAFHAPRAGFFPSIAATLNHILVVDLYYLDALEEGGIGRAVYDAFAPHDVPAALAPAQRETDWRLIDFCDRLTDADLSRRVVTERATDPDTDETVGALLAHLFQHAIHHRGQVHAMLSATDAPPPQLDEFFLDFERHPAAAAILAGERL